MELLKKALIVLLTYACLSCNTYKLSKEEYESGIFDSKMFEMECFKYDVFLYILGEAYKETNAFKEIVKVDKIVPTTDHYWAYTFTNVRDSISNEFVKNLPYYDGYAEYKSDREKKLYLQSALKFYHSKELDSLARHYVHISDKIYLESLKREEKRIQLLIKETRKRKEKQKNNPNKKL